MITILEKEAVQTIPNSIRADYYRFREMPARELDALQTASYSELHALRKEFDEILARLRTYL